MVSHFLKDPSTEQVACQAPKPILLDTGSVHVPYEWCVPEPICPCLQGVHIPCACCWRDLHSRKLASPAFVLIGTLLMPLCRAAGNLLIR